MKISYIKMWSLCKDLGITDKKLRSKTGISLDTLRKLKFNEEVSLKILLKVCQVLKCNIGDLVDAIDDSGKTERVMPSLYRENFKGTEIPTSVYFKYGTNGSEIKIKGYEGPAGEVVFPDYINNLPVTLIGERIFDDSQYRNTEITIKLPDTLSRIEDKAFRFMNNLTGVVTLPKKLIFVGEDAFYASDIEGLIIQSPICVFMDGALSNLHKLKFLYVRAGCNPINLWYFNSEELEEIIMPNEITKIQDGIFSASKKAVIYAPKGSYAEEYGRKNYIEVNTEKYEDVCEYYDLKYSLQ